MRIFTITIAFAAPLLSGCLESEKSCRDRLYGELDSLYETSEMMLNDPDTIASKSTIRSWQIALLGEKGRLSQLYSSKSVNVCDFYVDGMRLVKK